MKRTVCAAFLIVIAAATSGCGYNRMQQLEEDVFAAFGDLEASLQRRADLIPNLVATVKGYAAHEQETLTAVIEARSQATSIKLSPEDLSDPEKLEQYQQAQGALGSALSRLMVVVERYPDLKANQHFTDLMHQLEGTENRINVARVRYNDTVRQFNFSIRKFPNSLTNNMMLNLERKRYFEADEKSKETPEVEF
ncbi:MAG: LemA family protein [Spirochaetota bacterium]